MRFISRLTAIFVLLASPQVSWGASSRTIDADSITSSNKAKTFSLPAATDTLVGRVSTDTLTNKSVSGSTNTFTNIPLSTAVSGTLPAANGGAYGVNNLLQGSNFNCEDATTSPWSASGGTLSQTSTAANVAFGSQSCSWDSSAAAQTLDSASITVPAGLFGRPGVARVLIQCPAATCTHTATVNDGTNDLVTASTISVSTNYIATTMNFTYPSTGSIKLRISSVASNEPIIYYDMALLSEADNIQAINQTQFIGSAFVATTASCTVTRANTALGAFGTAAACPGPTVESNPGPGVIQTTDANSPNIFTVSALPPGVYRVQISGLGGATTAGAVSYAINDGTTTSGRGSGNSTSTAGSEFVVEGWFTYTTSTNRTFELFGSAVSGTTNNVYNNLDTAYTKFSIVRYPSSSELGFKPEQNPSHWSGYTTVAGGCSTASATYADTAACTSIAVTETTNRNFGTVTTAGSSLPGVTFTPNHAGIFRVTAKPVIANSLAGNISARLVDGSAVVLDPGVSATVAATGVATLPLSGKVSIASAGTSVTVKVRLATSTGTASIQNGTATGSGAIQWDIEEVDAVNNMPFIMGVRSQVTVDSGNGHGSTNNKLRRWSNIRVNTGTDITYADSATLGGSYTINSTGIYAVTCNDLRNGGGASSIGIVVNPTATTTSVSTPITYAQGLRAFGSRIEASGSHISWAGILNTGDVVYEQTDGTPDATNSFSMFTITRVGL